LPMCSGDGDRGAAARRQFSPEFAIAGRDGVHPGWAGQAVMAYAYSRPWGSPRDRIAQSGSKVGRDGGFSGAPNWFPPRMGFLSCGASGNPFCACVPPGGADNGYPVCGKADPGAGESIQAAMALVPFNHDLNRFTLVARHASRPITG